MPSGGPRDSAPPQVVKTYPENKAINFAEDKVVLYFDEFIELNQPLTNISVSPYSNDKPKASVLGKKVYLEFPGGFKANTTYSLEFKNAIKDYSEGNILSSFNLTFSTGPNLDSGKLSVIVHNAKTLLHNDLTKVCLVKNKSDFFGKNFRYVSSANAGRAQFSNLTSEPLYIYAFVDSNMNMTWDKTEDLAFSKEMVKAGQAEIDLKLFNQKQLKNNFAVSSKAQNEFDIFSSQYIAFPEISDTNFVLMPISDRQFKIIAKSSFKPQKLRLKFDGDKYESLELLATKPSKYIDKIKTTDNRIAQVFQNDTIRLSYNGFLSRLDANKIKLKSDEKPVDANYSIRKNQLIITGLNFGKTYQLSLDSQALWSFNRFNSPHIQEFSTFPKEKFFDTIIITLDPSLAANKNAKIFQLKENQWLPLEKQPKTSFRNQYGDELRFYILIDENKDGLWTTGDIEKEIQPEKLYLETIKLEVKKADYILKITNP
jgi:hypothetical protein